MEDQFKVHSEEARVSSKRNPLSPSNKQYKVMELHNNSQIPHQNATSTTMWTQPVTEEQKRYYSKHSPKRKVYGWIMTLLQTAHGFLAFAAWTAIYLWVFNNVPGLLFLAPILSISTLFALHILFRTTWDTFWYDRLDDDPNTDSSVFMPLAIIALLLFAEVNGARQYLSAQVKPVERLATTEVDQSHQAALSTIESSYERDKKEITAIYKEKERATAAPFNRQINSLNARGEKSGAIQAQRDKAVNAIKQQKADALQSAFQQYTQGKASATARTESNLGRIDNHNANEAARYTSELGSVGTYAWFISVALLSLIAGLGYVRVRINVKSGILPLRNYTVLDAHGSVIERFATAFGDAFNRRSLQLAVWFHKLLSPKKAITSFDGTIVSQPGTYNTPKGLFPPAHTPVLDEAALKAKVLQKVMAEAENGGLYITTEMLQQELEKAETMNGSYLSSPMGKPEPSATPAIVEGKPYPAVTPTYDQKLREWASHFQRLIQIYDTEMAQNRPTQAQEQMAYINHNDGPVVKGANHLGVKYGIVSGQPEIMVWRSETPGHKVPLSQVSEATLSNAPDQPEAGEIEDLFKQSINVFKQTILPQLDSDGQVIGVKYRKRDNDWVTYPLTQVEAYVRNYQQRAAKKPTLANNEGLEKWSYALSLFDRDPRLDMLIETASEELAELKAVTL